MEKYIEEIKAIIEDVNEYESFDESTNLFDSEILSSLSLMYLITELEDRYDIIIEDDMIIPENFSTIMKIAQTLQALVEK